MVFCTEILDGCLERRCVGRVCGADGAVITNDSLTKNEINRTISLGKAAMANMTYMTKASGVSTTLKLVQTTDFPAVLYGFERQMQRKANRR